MLNHKQYRGLHKDNSIFKRMAYNKQHISPHGCLHQLQEKTDVHSVKMAQQLNMKQLQGTVEEDMISKIDANHDPLL